MRNVVYAVMVGAALSGCAGTLVSQSADEFRERVKGSTRFGSTETIQVPRSYAQVSEALRKKANECLTVTVVSVSTERSGGITAPKGSRTTYNPTLTETKKGTQLTVQAAQAKKALQLQKVPENGFYIFAADAKAAGENATALTIYLYTVDGRAKKIDSAVRDWARGDNMSCPDLNR